MTAGLRQAALDYHREPRPRKLEIPATKRLATQRDLDPANSPAVAVACGAMQAERPWAWCASAARA